MVAECCLLEGDFEGFRSVTASLREPGMARGVEARFALVHVLDGVDALLRTTRRPATPPSRKPLRRRRDPPPKKGHSGTPATQWTGAALAEWGQPGPPPSTPRQPNR